MDKNKLMAQLLMGHVLGATTGVPEAPVVTFEDWYAKQPYEKIDPALYYVGMYIDNDTKEYRVYIGRKDEKGEDIVLSTLRIKAKNEEQGLALLTSTCRAMPCMPVENEDGTFGYPFFDETLKEKLLRRVETTGHIVTAAEERRAKRAAKLAENIRKSREGHYGSKG